MPLEESSGPKPMYPAVRTWNFRHLTECVDGQVTVRARGKSFTGSGWIEFAQCVPFTPEEISDAIRMHAARLNVSTNAPRADHFVMALHNALIAAAASAGEVIDPDTILVEMFV